MAVEVCKTENCGPYFFLTYGSASRVRIFPRRPTRSKVRSTRIRPMRREGGRFRPILCASSENISTKLLHSTLGIGYHL